MKATLKTANTRRIIRTKTAYTRENGLNGDENTRPKSETKQNGNGQEIVNIGRDPWLVKELAGQVTVRRGNANQWSVTLLDEAGYPVRVQKLSEDSQIKLEPTTIYYLLDAGK